MATVLREQESKGGLDQIVYQGLWGPFWSGMGKLGGQEVGKPYFT